VMEGNIEDFISALRFAENVEKMKTSGMVE
jgi:peptide chain release factor 1